MASLISLYNGIVRSRSKRSEWDKLRHRVEAAVFIVALDVREEAEPAIVTDQWRARQQWAINALRNPETEAERIWPALLVKANNAGLLTDNAVPDPPDTVIINAVKGLVSVYSNYVPPVPTV